MKVNDIVLVCEENLPRGDWPVARVREVNYGVDGRPRSVKLLVRGKKKLRPISKICFLEHHQ